MKRRLPSAAPSSSRLEHYRDSISRCVRCGTCRAVCPAFLPDRQESLSARGRMALIEAVLEGRLSVSSLYRDRLATCTGCLACETACPGGVPVTEIVQAAKEEALRLEGPGLIHRMVSASLSDERLMRALAWLAPVVLHYAGKSVRGRGILMRNAEPETRERCRMPDAGFRIKDKPCGRVAFFPGCAVSYFQPDIERASINVLNALGYEVIIPDGLECCGKPLLGLGDRRAAEASALRNTAVLSSLNAEAVVTACASCGLTFKKEYPTLLAPFGQSPVPVLDIHEFLAGKLDSARLRALVPGAVTWHDPCHLGRGQGLSRTARTVLHAVPGLVLREMDAPDRCCGFGGVMRVGHHGLSDRIGDAKASDIIATGASLVITGCPGCRMQIADSLRRAGSDAVVIHTVQVVEAALPNAECGVRNWKWQDHGSRGRRPGNNEREGEGRMKFFIDTANVKEIREAASLGVVDGVTTNPSLVAKEGRDFKEVINEICSVVDGPISAEAVSLKADEMVAEGEGLAKIHKNIVVKLPMTKDGMKATKVLAKKGIRVNMTLVFSPMQALLAAKVGAAYVSPFVGRLDDISHYGMDLVRQIVQVYENYGYPTEVIVASVRNPIHVLDAALAGAHIATIPFSVIDQLVKHPLTDIGIEKFLSDWKKLEKK